MTKVLKRKIKLIGRFKLEDKKSRSNRRRRRKKRRGEKLVI